MTFEKDAIASVMNRIGSEAETDAIAAVLSGTAGISAFPAAAAPANDVSMAEVLRAIYDAVGKRLLTANQTQGQPVMVTRATATPIDESLFTIAGGNIQLLEIIGEVTTVIETQTDNTKLVFNPTATGASTNLCANLDITADAVGTLYSITGVIADAMKSTTVLFVAPADNLPWPGIILAPGDIELDVGATNTGSIEWHIVYRALEAGATVVAA